MIRVYADFNCPFCFVQHGRIKQLQLQQPVEWRFVEHAPNLNSSVHSESAMQTLNFEFGLITQRAPGVQINKPEFCVNSRVAILSFISVQHAYPELAMDYLSEIYKAYWQQGLDISDTIVLRNILVQLGIDEFGFCHESEVIQQHWQQAWINGGFEERIPAMSSAKDRVLLGLQHIDNIGHFIANTKGPEFEVGDDCSFQDKSTIAILSAGQAIDNKLLSREAFNLHYFKNSSDLIGAYTSGRPDIIIIDFEMDKQNKFQMIELFKQALDLRLKEIPLIYYFKTAKAQRQLALAYTLGAIDTFSAADDSSLINAKLKRRTIDSRKLFLLSQHSMVDSLTGVYNRRKLDIVLENFWRIGCRKKLPLSIIMVDIDFFKQYNDYYGHLEGDQCLVKIARILKHRAQRSSDIVIRFGGEEFMIILFDVSASEAENIAQQMRSEIETANIAHLNRSTPKHITASFGVCSLYPHPDYTPSQIIALADKAMYRSKELGRNTVTSVVMEAPDYIK